MEYRTLITFADGWVESRAFPALTDVEEYVVEALRRADGIKSKVLHIQMILPTKKEY